MLDIIRIDQVLQISILAFSILVAIISIIGAFKAGVFKKLRFDHLDIGMNEKKILEDKRLVQSFQVMKALNDESIEEKQTTSYELEELAKYYAQILEQSKISFWFSLIFASIGFIVIITAMVFYKSGDIGNTIISLISGTIIDAVASLFFVQSRNSQKAMDNFFDKLRKDRQQMEARKLSEEIEDKFSRDALRVHLALHFADVSNINEIGKTICRNVQDA